jgi:hypothetical protein
MAAKLIRLTHKIGIQLYLVAESCNICSSRSRRPVRKLLDTPLCMNIVSILFLLRLIRRKTLETFVRNSVRRDCGAGWELKYVITNALVSPSGPTPGGKRIWYSRLWEGALTKCQVRYLNTGFWKWLSIFSLSCYVVSACPAPLNVITVHMLGPRRAVQWQLPEIRTCFKKKSDWVLW